MCLFGCIVRPILMLYLSTCMLVRGAILQRIPFSFFEGKTRDNPLRHMVAFPRAERYSKSVYSDHRKVWSLAPSAAKQEAIDARKTDTGRWSVFYRKHRLPKHDVKIIRQRLRRTARKLQQEEDAGFENTAGLDFE